MRGSNLTSRTPIMAFSILLLLASAFPVAAKVPDKHSPETVDLAEIPRKIAKEPTYRSESPGYCLLVFGLEAKTRVWLVVDGKSAYLDRNGNGDLTESGERINAQGGEWLRLGDVTELDGETKHRDLRIKTMEDSTFELTLRSSDNIHRHVGRVESLMPRLAAKPADAPIIHPNGPIALAPYTPINFAFRSARERRKEQFEWLNLVAGSPGLGPGTFTVIYPVIRVGCDGDRNVLADIEFPSRTADAPPIISKQSLMTEG